MFSWRSSRAAFAALLVLAVSAAPARAEDGRVSGAVHDASGGVVPGATISIANQATAASQTAISGADGTYSFSVAPGLYSVTAALKGFGKQS